MARLFLVDASSFLYRSYFAIRNITNAKGESTNALYGFIRSIKKLIKDFNPEYLVAVFDGPKSIQSRKEIYADYKANRAEMPGDLRYQITWAKEFCPLAGIPLLDVPEVEADDTIGTIAKWAEKEGNEVFICSSDKDLCQLVSPKVKMLHAHKDNLILDQAGVKEKYGVPPEKIIDLLAITGDSSDNVPGLSGFGPKTAVQLLEKFPSLDYILEHPEEIPGAKKQETIKQQAEIARLSRQLVTLNTSVLIPKELPFFSLVDPQKEDLKAFYVTMNFNSLLKELEQTGDKAEEEQTITYHLVDDHNALKELLSLLSKQKEVCFDTETTSEHPIGAELVGIGFAIAPHEAWYIPTNGALGLDTVLKAVQPLFENREIAFYGHNVKYDLHILANYDIHVKTISFDTILASYVLNSHVRQHSLDALSLQYFGKVKIPLTDLIGKGKSAITMREVPIEKASHYCCEDVDYTLQLKQLFHPELKERRMESLFYHLELPLMHVLAKMERHGIFCDAPILHALGTKVKTEIEALQKKIYSLAGEEFNLNSPKQMSEVLFTKMGLKPPKKTATGYSTDASTLETLSHEHPIAAEIIQYRLLEKLRSTYIESLPEQINPKTHRIHSTFNQSVAATGRLSSQDPNLQNIPARTETGRKIREAFRPEKEGWSFLSADYSQIELRLLAHLSGDPTLIQAFQENQDIHAHTAATIFGIPLDQVTKELRQQAKAVNFGVIYGQQAFGLSQGLKIDIKDAEAFIKMYFERYPKVKEFIELCKERARKSGKGVTETGRERLIPEITSKNWQIRSAAERLAINTPIQGTSADLIKKAMLLVDKKITQEGFVGYMILQIHDELIFEIPNHEVLPFETIVKQAMEGVTKLKVPLVVNINVGKNWKEC